MTKPPVSQLRGIWLCNEALSLMGMRDALIINIYSQWRYISSQWRYIKKKLLYSETLFTWLCCETKDQTLGLNSSRIFSRTYGPFGFTGDLLNDTRPGLDTGRLGDLKLTFIWKLCKRGTWCWCCPAEARTTRLSILEAYHSRSLNIS